jgi:hypothetical protein
VQSLRLPPLAPLTASLPCLRRSAPPPPFALDLLLQPVAETLLPPLLSPLSSLSISVSARAGAQSPLLPGEEALEGMCYAFFAAPRQFLREWPMGA